MVATATAATATALAPAVAAPTVAAACVRRTQQALLANRDRPRRWLCTRWPVFD